MAREPKNMRIGWGHIATPTFGHDPWRSIRVTNISDFIWIDPKAPQAHQTLPLYCDSQEKNVDFNSFISLGR